MKKNQITIFKLVLGGFLVLLGFVAGGQYVLWQSKNVAKSGAISAAKPSGDIDIEQLKRRVLPDEGFRVRVKWGNMGKKLVELGVIDRTKFDPLFTDQPDVLKYLTANDEDTITVTAATARFWVDALWALGLANKSPVLTEGPMMEGGKPGNFASTGGWTLARKDAMQYYAKFDLVPLTPEQHGRVKSISENIYRPCCGNSTAFPDCNHGMAALALVELMVSQGSSDAEIYEAVLRFNSFWFTQTYLELAYQQAKNGITWDRVDPKMILGKSFSSAMGYQAIHKQIGDVPGLTSGGGGGCGA